MVVKYKGEYQRFLTLTTRYKIIKLSDLQVYLKFNLPSDVDFKQHKSWEGSLHSSTNVLCVLWVTWFIIYQMCSCRAAGQQKAADCSLVPDCSYWLTSLCLNTYLGMLCCKVSTSSLSVWPTEDMQRDWACSAASSMTGVIIAQQLTVSMLSSLLTLLSETLQGAAGLCWTHKISDPRRLKSGCSWLESLRSPGLGGCGH